MNVNVDRRIILLGSLYEMAEIRRGRRIQFVHVTAALCGRVPRRIRRLPLGSWRCTQLPAVRTRHPSGSIGQSPLVSLIKDTPRLDTLSWFQWWIIEERATRNFAVPALFHRQDRRFEYRALNFFRSRHHRARCDLLGQCRVLHLYIVYCNNLYFMLERDVRLWQLFFVETQL